MGAGASFAGAGESLGSGFTKTGVASIGRVSASMTWMGVWLSGLTMPVGGNFESTGWEGWVSLVSSVNRDAGDVVEVGWVKPMAASAFNSP
jgi:hypothetical protein